MKPYGFIVMLLIGLLVPMTIASKSVDFQVNTLLFDNQEIAITVDVLKLTQPQITKSMITREVAEGIQKRRLIGSIKVNHITLLPDICTYRPNSAKMEGQQSFMMVRNQVDYVVYVLYRYNDNLIRYL